MTVIMLDEIAWHPSRVHLEIFSNAKNLGHLLRKSAQEIFETNPYSLDSLGSGM